jgi:tRNA (adenine57-N1/adenine58-N1)-methyltransferase
MATPGTEFVEGESCLLYDDRDKQYLLTLRSGSDFHYDRGVVPHDSIIGAAEGSALRSSRDFPVTVLRPRLADYTLRMKRGAAVMYPKDTGAIVTWADIAPGSTVLEAGTGSGALTLALSRATGSAGRVVTVDTREDHQTHARRLIEQFGGDMPTNIEFRVGDVADHVADVQPTRIVLDLPEPWHCAHAAASDLTGGGVFAAYLPTVPQVQQLRDVIEASRAFIEIDTFEILMRSWAVSGRSVRPEHRMVGHTGFITVARRRL